MGKSRPKKITYPCPVCNKSCGRGTIHGSRLYVDNYLIMLKTPPPASHVHPQSTGPTDRAMVGGAGGAGGTFSDTDLFVVCVGKCRFTVGLEVFIYNGSSAGNQHFCDLIVRVNDVINIEKTSHQKSKI